MLKKQHILLGALLLGMSIKPMEKSDSHNMALGVGGGVVATGIGLIGCRLYSSYKTQKQLFEDKGPYGSEIDIYSRETHDKTKSNLPFFGIADTSREESTMSLSGIDQDVKSKHIPSLWDIFKGRSEYYQLNSRKIKRSIEFHNPFVNNSSPEKKIKHDLICGWLEGHKGVKTLHLVRCLSRKSKNKSGLHKKYRFFEAWLGNTKDNSCEQLLEFEEDGVKILAKEIKNKNSFIVFALFTSLFIWPEVDSMNDHYKTLYGKKIIGNVRKMIDNHTIQDIILYHPHCAFFGINIKEGTKSAITVIQCYNNDEL